MATGSIPLLAVSLVPPDGSTSNVAAKFQMLKGSNTAPNRFLPSWAFAHSSTMTVWATVPIPANYSSGGTLRLDAVCVTAASGNVRWSASFGFQTVTASDSALAHNQATAVAVTVAVPATTAYRPFEASITLGMDSAAASGIGYLCIQRLGSDAADTATADVNLLGAVIDYTTT